MRDDRTNWDAPNETAEVLRSDGLIIRQIWPERQVLISGVGAAAATDLPLVSWPDVVTAEAYALILRRDRILEVNGANRDNGWDGVASIAVSDVSDGYSAVAISGQGALDLLKRGGVVSIHQPSKSVMRLMFGHHVMLYRGGGTEFRIHIGRGHLQSLRKALVDNAGGM